jgi:hypothetical protein
MIQSVSLAKRLSYIVMRGSVLVCVLENALTTVEGIHPKPFA